MPCIQWKFSRLWSLEKSLRRLLPMKSSRFAERGQIGIKKWSVFSRNWRGLQMGKCPRVHEFHGDVKASWEKVGARSERSLEKIVYNENFRTFEIELQERAEEEGQSNWLDRFMLLMWGPSTWRSRHLRSDKWETGTEEIPFEWSKKASSRTWHMEKLHVALILNTELYP